MCKSMCMLAMYCSLSIDLLLLSVLNCFNLMSFFRIQIGRISKLWRVPKFVPPNTAWNVITNMELNCMREVLISPNCAAYPNNSNSVSESARLTRSGWSPMWGPAGLALSWMRSSTNHTVKNYETLSNTWLIAIVYSSLSAGDLTCHQFWTH